MKYIVCFCRWRTMLCNSERPTVCGGTPDASAQPRPNTSPALHLTQSTHTMPAINNNQKLDDLSENCESPDHCVTVGYRKRCRPCHSKYVRESKRKQRQENKLQADMKIKTRSVNIKKRTKYYHVLCEQCKKKKVLDYCSECSSKYTSVKQVNYRQMKQVRNKYQSVSKGVCQDLSVGHETKIKSKGKSQVSGLCNNIKSVSKDICQVNAIGPVKKTHKKKTVANTVVKKSRTQAKKGKKSLKNKDFIDPITGDFEDKYSEGTIDNAASKFNTTIGHGSPIKTFKTISKIANKADLDTQVCMFRKYMPQLHVEKKVGMNDKVMKEICDNYLRLKKINKSADKYELLTALASVIKGKSIKEIRVLFSLSHKKASQLKSGSVKRKKRKLKINDKDRLKIKHFYHRQDISRREPGKSTKKNGLTSYMRVTGRCAYKKFRKVHPEVAICLSNFFRLRPKNIKPLHKTPLNMCQCDKCSNINCKLKVLNIPEIKNEQDLYKALICEKTGRFRHADCVEQTCGACRNWRQKIEFYAMNLDENRSIHWQRWENIEYKQKSGKTVIKKVLKTKSGTVRDCLNELIEHDVLNPGKNITFVKHFFNQSYQFQVYQDCKKSLKPGQCLAIQDFSRNIEIYYRHEIKASNWSKKQVTVHPTVLFYKIPESEEEQRLVITHLSDLNTHDATLVHYITKDCIDILLNLYPDIEWKKFFLWSDGCSAQYKGKHSFYFLSEYRVQVERNFFGSEHGKNECDGITGQISIQYNTAVKADEVIISNANDLKNYLCTVHNNDKSKIFKLIEKDNKELECIRKAFDEVNVKVLSGKCTRTLHQIKAGEKSGNLLTRPLSCFCDNCSQEDYENCQNKGHTKGKFTERILKFTNANGNNSTYANEEEEEDDMNLNSEIRVEKKRVKFSDLQVDDIVIVPVGDCETEFHPAQITKIESRQSIYIDYLVPKYDNPEILVKSTSIDYNDYIVPLHDIVMRLPKPKEQRRGRFIFKEKIILNS